MINCLQNRKVAVICNHITIWKQAVI